MHQKEVKGCDFYKFDKILKCFAQLFALFTANTKDYDYLIKLHDERNIISKEIELFSVLMDMDPPNQQKKKEAVF